MERLAMFGGPRAAALGSDDAARIAWPIVTDAERQAVLSVLDQGGFTSIGAGARVVRELEREWAAFTATRHCAAVASGTAAIEVALAAAGLEPGAEILVPALSFIASATAPVQRMLVPVFVDVDPITYTIDPDAAEAAVTPRTQAILAVHLHGLPCDMAALRDLADRHELLLVEDAAQAHAATYRNRPVGGLGDVAAFSLNASKNLPTCGEGGLATTNDPALHERMVLHRQFGEDTSGTGPRTYLSQVLAGNAKLSAIEAAFTRCQLERLPERHAERDKNVRALLSRLGGLPGLTVPSCPADRTHAWYLLRLRFDIAVMGYPDVAPGAMRSMLHRALRAEGVPVAQYQRVPLPGQPALRNRAGFSGLPWRLEGSSTDPYRPQDHPVTVAVVEDSLVLQHWHLNPSAGPLLDRCADAFEKVWRQLDTLAAAGRAMQYEPAWQTKDFSR